MSRLDKLEARRIDPSIRTRMAKEVYRTIRDSDSIRYAIGAMQAIDPEYTANTFREGDRVKNQLATHLSETCDFEYQGSTTNDTHVKAKSDIDLLVLLTRWWWADTVVNPYKGDVKADMRDLRSDTEEVIADAFPAVTLDNSRPKSIRLAGGSLSRRVDVVPATWYNMPTYLRTGEKAYRGVKIFNRDSGEFISNRPFLFNRRVDEKDRGTLGGMRKATRLMKSLMYDSDRLDMTSFNITSIAYNIPNHMLAFEAPQELRILEACREYCGELQSDPSLRNRIQVPDESRPVFGDDAGATVTQLDELISELAELIVDIFSESARSFKKLAEARVEYATL